LLQRVTPIDHFPLIFWRGGGLKAGTWPYGNRKGSREVAATALGSGIVSIFQMLGCKHRIAKAYARGSDRKGIFSMGSPAKRA
jgi:hypothetical protein